jgi:hypothetical protein
MSNAGRRIEKLITLTGPGTDSPRPQRCVESMLAMPNVVKSEMVTDLSTVISETLWTAVVG